MVTSTLNKWCFNRHIHKSISVSVLVCSSLLGGMTLSGGEAKATATCFSFDTPSPPGSGITSLSDPCIDGDWRASFINFTAPAGTPNQMGQVVLEDLTNLQPDRANVTINFNDTTATGSSGVYEYTITNGGNPIGEVGLDVTEGTPVSHSFQVFKYVYADSGFTNLIGGAPLFVDENTVDDVLFTNHTQLWIRDTWSTSSPGIVQITNSYTSVPGPLPLLGPIAVFGSLRKLRTLSRSVKAAQ
ncbi:MAG: hypothetical protein VKP70_07765 [Cyanobacteriota bacterium]|nr:hypothetical protein [Cyanobacteriota bacterium]